VVRFLNKNLKQQYKVWKNFKELKSTKNIDLEPGLTTYSKSGYLLVVQYLVDNGANIHFAENYAIQLAAHNGHLPIVKYLVNPPVNPADLKSALFNTIGIERSSRRDDLVSKGSNINALNKALFSATNKGHLNIVQYLVSKGANIHADNDRALGYAADKGHLPIVLYLLSLGANTDSLTAEQKAEFNIN